MSKNAVVPIQKITVISECNYAYTCFFANFAIFGIDTSNNLKSNFTGMYNKRRSRVRGTEWSSQVYLSPMCIDVYSTNRLSQ
jgi:hypothetical protein